MSLPDPSTLIWSHATNSREKLEAALSNPEINAIEADIMMGYHYCEDMSSDNCQERLVIMSHPPYERSNLSAEEYLECVLGTNNSSNDDDASSSVAVRHAKLDFKQIEAVSPVLKLISDKYRPKVGQILFLNADILPGPGVRSEVFVSADEFIETCVRHIQSMPASYKNNFAFSLGYRVDYKSGEAYMCDDVAAMASIVTKYDLNRVCGGVVLALNARTLALDPVVFDTFLSIYETAQILAWTGAGEIPIPQSSIDTIKKHFDKTGCLKRVGFDCDVDKKASTTGTSLS